MNKKLTEWLNTKSKIRGVLACGIYFADQTSTSLSYSTSYPLVFLGNTWRGIAESYQVLQMQQRVSGEFVRWTFTNALLHCAQRKDSAYLGLLTVRDPGGVDGPNVDQFLREFIDFSAKNP